MNGKIISKCNRVLWLDKAGESKLDNYVADGYPDTNDRSLGNHRWAKSPRYVRYLLEAFWGTVFDPFCGGGTVPAVCKLLDRNYIAFEIVSKIANDARERILNLQPSLFILEPEQQEMEI